MDEHMDVNANSKQVPKIVKNFENSE